LIDAFPGFGIRQVSTLGQSGNFDPGKSRQIDEFTCPQPYPIAAVADYFNRHVAQPVQCRIRHAVLGLTVSVQQWPGVQQVLSYPIQRLCPRTEIVATLLCPKLPGGMPRPYDGENGGEVARLIGSNVLKDVALGERLEGVRLRLFQDSDAA